MTIKLCRFVALLKFDRLCLFVLSAAHFGLTRMPKTNVKESVHARNIAHSTHGDYAIIEFQCNSHRRCTRIEFWMSSNMPWRTQWRN